MIKNPKKTLSTLLLLTVLTGLTACSGTPTSLSDIFSPSSSIESADADIQRANALLRQGKHIEAADAYYNASKTRVPPQRERLILQAAEIAASVKDKSLAQHYLTKVNRSNLSEENRARYRYVQGLLAMIDNRYQVALQVLPSQQGNISRGLWEKIYRARQQASNHMQGTAKPNQPQQTQSRPSAVPQASNRIAVLLPLSGRLGTLGNTIYQGIKSQQAAAPGTQVRPYDTASADINTQYQRAVNEGADVVIGPLDKRKLASLISQNPNLARPIISLNQLNEGQSRAPAALYQFGLSPEDEARQIANFAISRGQRRAAMMYPNSQWGKRLAAAFTRMYTSRGGQIVAEEAYPNTDRSYKASVQQALSAGVANTDMIFLAASPTQARLIRPMIQHMRGASIPLYATSHIYSGVPDAGKNTDLNGIIYTEIPYIIEGSQVGAITASSGKYPRLFALGADSLLIAKNLGTMVRSRQPLQGKTGNIRVGGNRLLQRQLSWATFIGGLTTSYGE